MKKQAQSPGHSVRPVPLVPPLRQRGGRGGA